MHSGKPVVKMRLWWAAYGRGEYHLLLPVPLKVMPLQVSSDASEAVFSYLKSAVTDHRTRMKSELVNGVILSTAAFRDQSRHWPWLMAAATTLSAPPAAEGGGVEERDAILHAFDGEEINRVMEEAE